MSSIQHSAAEWHVYTHIYGFKNDATAIVICNIEQKICGCMTGSQCFSNISFNPHTTEWFWYLASLNQWELTHWKRPWSWERLKAGGEGDDRRWDGWMASSTWWHEFVQAPGVDDGQGSLVCWSPWGCKESDTTEWLNWINEETQGSLRLNTLS